MEAWCAAGITAVRHEDCGPCTQLGVDNADAMPPDVALVWKFTRAPPAHDEYREAIMKRWGRRVLVSLALGHGKACTRVVVGRTPLTFDHGRVPALADVTVSTP